MRQCSHVLNDDLLSPERLPEGIACRVVLPVTHRDGPLHHGPEPLPHAPRGFGLVVPDGSEDCQHVGRGHHGHRQSPETRKRISAQAARPFPRVFGVSPAGTLLRQHCGGRLLDRGHALAVASFGQRVPACSCSLTVGDCRLACLGQGHQGIAAEAEHAGVTSND